MANIERFKGTFTEMARMNRFRCSGFGLDGRIEFWAKGAQLPATTIGAMDVPYQGRVIKMAGDRVFNDFTMTVYNDDDMTIRKEFEEWIELLNGVDSNIGDTVKRDGFVHQLGRNDEILATFEIRGAIPIDVSAIELAWDSNDTPSEFTVSLAYDLHTMT